jgi:hypothetical protein
VCNFVGIYMCLDLLTYNMYIYIERERDVYICVCTCVGV